VFKWLLGLLRIHVAANNADDEFGSEVRTALTNDAFQFHLERIFIEKKQKN